LTNIGCNIEQSAGGTGEGTWLAGRCLAFPCHRP